MFTLLLLLPMEFLLFVWRRVAVRTSSYVRHVDVVQALPALLERSLKLLACHLPPATTLNPCHTYGTTHIVDPPTTACCTCTCDGRTAEYLFTTLLRHGHAHVSLGSAAGGAASAAPCVLPYVLVRLPYSADPQSEYGGPDSPFFLEVGGAGWSAEVAPTRPSGLRALGGSLRPSGLRSGSPSLSLTPRAHSGCYPLIYPHGHGQRTTYCAAQMGTYLVLLAVAVRTMQALLACAGQWLAGGTAAPAAQRHPPPFCERCKLLPSMHKPVCTMLWPDELGPATVPKAVGQLPANLHVRLGPGRGALLPCSGPRSPVPVSRLGPRSPGPPLCLQHLQGCSVRDQEWRSDAQYESFPKLLC